MKTIKWLISLADVKPVIFSLAMLLIAVMVLSGIVKERNDKLNICDERVQLLIAKYQHKVDSLANAYKEKEEVLNSEVKETLNYIIIQYKEQLKEQKNINREVNKVINKNRSLINKKNK